MKRLLAILSVALLLSLFVPGSIRAESGPSITESPKDAIVEVGATAEFSVVANATTDLSYQWQSRKDAQSTWSNSGQSGAKTSTLSIAALAGLHGWEFRCAVTDGNGQKVYSEAAKLSVIPKINTQPSDASVKAGSTANFTVAASGKATLSYQWQSRKDSTSSWSNSGQTGSKTAALSVTTIAGLDGWQFRCVVTDGNGQKTYSEAATLSVLPMITTNPKDASVAAGSVAKFTVAATGKATLKYQWQSRKDATGSWSNSGQTGSKTATLSVTAIVGLDGWQFRCVVTDGNGQKVYSEAATLAVLPAITTQPVNASAAVGSTAKFTIAATGKAPLTYRWQSKKDESSSWANSGLSTATSPTLSVTASNGLDGYQFRCVVTDANGRKVYSDGATFTALPTITAQPKNASAKVGSEVTFSVTASGKTPLSYQWQSRKNADAAWANSGMSTAKTAALTVSAAAGLDGYQFRCVVTGANGQKAYSNPATLSILLNITAQPKNTSASVGSTAKFTVAATGKATLTYQWQSRKNSDAEWTNSGASGAKTATLSVNALAGLDGYQFRCVITDGYGNKAYSNAATLTINLSITTQPQNASVAIGSTAKFTVAAAGKAPLTYQWQSRKDSSSSWANSGASGAKSASLSISATAGLDGYQFRCVVTDGNGKKVYSNAATLTIPLVITSQPQNVYTTVDSEALFSIKASGVGPLKYQWQLDMYGIDNWINVDADGGDSPNLTVPAMDAFNGFLFRCRVTDSKGRVVYSNIAKLSIQLVPGLYLPENPVRIKSNVATFDVNNISYTMDGTTLVFKAVVRPVQYLYTSYLHDCWFQLDFYDANNILVYRKSSLNSGIDLGKSAYVTERIGTKNIEGAVYVEIVPCLK